MYLHSIQHLRHKLQTFVLELHQVNLKFSLFHWNHCIDRNEQQHEGQTCKQKDKPFISPRCTHQMLIKIMSNKWSDNHFKMKCLESFIGISIMIPKTGFIEIKLHTYMYTNMYKMWNWIFWYTYLYLFFYFFLQLLRYQLHNFFKMLTWILLCFLTWIHYIHFIFMKFIFKVYTG